MLKALPLSACSVHYVGTPVATTNDDCAESHKLDCRMERKSRGQITILVSWFHGSSKREGHADAGLNIGCPAIPGNLYTEMTKKRDAAL